MTTDDTRKRNAEKARKWRAKLTPEQRSEISAKAWEKRKETVKNFTPQKKDELKAKITATNYHWRRRRFYGITEEEYQAMLKQQKNKCAIKWCGRRANAIDHCYKRKGVRGLLCKQCNTVLGLVGDSQKQLIALAAYLKDSSKRKLIGGVPLPLRRHKHTEEWKEQLRQRMTGNTYALGSKSTLGRKRPAEERMNMSIAAKKRWDNMTDAERQSYEEKGRAAAQKRWGGVLREAAQ